MRKRGECAEAIKRTLKHDIKKNRATSHLADILGLERGDARPGRLGCGGHVRRRRGRGRQRLLHRGGQRRVVVEVGGGAREGDHGAYAAVQVPEHKREARLASEVSREAMAQ